MSSLWKHRAQDRRLQGLPHSPAHPRQSYRRDSSTTPPHPRHAHIRTARRRRAQEIRYFRDGVNRGRPKGYGVRVGCKIGVAFVASEGIGMGGGGGIGWFC